MNNSSDNTINSTVITHTVCLFHVPITATSCKATTQLIIIGWHVHCSQGNETLV